MMPPFSNTDVIECNEQLGYKYFLSLDPPFSNTDVIECNGRRRRMGRRIVIRRHSVTLTSSSATRGRRLRCAPHPRRHSVTLTSSSATVAAQPGGAEVVPPFSNTDVIECNRLSRRMSWRRMPAIQ